MKTHVKIHIAGIISASQISQTSFPSKHPWSFLFLKAKLIRPLPLLKDRNDILLCIRASKYRRGHQSNPKETTERQSPLLQASVNKAIPCQRSYRKHLRWLSTGLPLSFSPLSRSRISPTIYNMCRAVVNLPFCAVRPCHRFLSFFLSAFQA